MSAGVLMNILLAIVFFTGITLHTGLAEVTDEPVVMDVTSGFPAKEAGIVSGDRILTVEGQPINKWTDLTTIVHASPDQEITVTWEHNQQKITAVLKTRTGPIPDGYGMKEVGLIGVTGGYEIRGAGLGESFVNGIGQTGYWFGMIVRSLTMIATGEASMKEIGGPILIAQLAGESARAGMIALLSFTAIISINLAFINILPIPGLDGGHILLVTLEAITRRQFSLKVRMVIQQAGMAMLLLLIIVVIYNDLSRIFTN
jgi:regulator of sigma E protease